MGLQPKLIAAISRKGERDQNEDFIVPAEPSEERRVFVVCDGVGGNHQGEIASKIVAESIEYYLNIKTPFLFLNRAYLTKSLRFAEERLSEYIEVHPESKGMASTVVCLEIDQKKAMGFWVGDSKIFHIREQKILFESKDHTLYEELKDQPKTDEKTLENFPFKNYILRAVKGNHHPAQAEFFILNDIKPGDFFMLVTDGILESMTHKELVKLAGENMNSEEMKKAVINHCSGKSKDNYSIQIIKLEAN